MPKAVVDQRVAAVFGWIVDGLATWDIRRRVAKVQKREAKRREEARKAQSPPDEAAVLHAVPFVWGDTPIADRTLDRYIAKAKTVLDEEAAAFAAKRGRMLAEQATRLNNLYAKAAAGGKFYAALKAAELTIELFGLKDHARNLQLAGATEDGASGPALLPSDPAARANAFASLMADAVGTSPELREQLAALTPRSVMP